MGFLKTRPDWGEWANGIAQAVSVRGDCTRRQVGAVILDERHRVIGCGYNGGPRGGPSCLAGECPRGRHFALDEPYERVCGSCRDDGAICSECTFLFKCACGAKWPCVEAVDPGSSYDTGPGMCVAVHAEINALLDVSDRRRLEGATLFVTEEPCGGCRKILANTAIKSVIWPTGRIG